MQGFFSHGQLGGASRDIQGVAAAQYGDMRTLVGSMPKESERTTPRSAWPCTNPPSRGQPFFASLLLAGFAVRAGAPALLHIPLLPPTSIFALMLPSFPVAAPMAPKDNAQFKFHLYLLIIYRQEKIY